MRTLIGLNELLSCLESFINIGRSGEIDEDCGMFFAEKSIFSRLLGSYSRVCDSCYVDEDNFAFCAAFGLIKRFTKYLADIAENNYKIPAMYVLTTWLPLLNEANDNKYRLQNIQNRRYSYFKIITLLNKIGCPITIKYFHPIERVNTKLDVCNDRIITMVATSPDLYFQIVIEEMAFESKPMRISVDGERNQPLYKLRLTKEGFKVELNEYSD